MDECHLREIGHYHSIGAGAFIPFVVTRLRRDRTPHQAVIRLRLEDIPGRADCERDFRILWGHEDEPVGTLPVSDRVITEWAAYGVSCAVLWYYTGLRVRQVAREGDRFDYWVSDGERDFGMEISGLLDGDLDSRHRSKVEQLRSNPYEMDGFVVVVNFGSRSGVLSFHRITGGFNG